MWWLVLTVLKSVISTIVSSKTAQWFKKSTFGAWIDNQIQRFAKWLDDKYDIELFKKELKWRKDYPLLAERIDLMRERITELEKQAHPPIGMCEFDGYDDLIKRIEELEKNNEQDSDGDNSGFRYS